jgi:cytosine permease
MTAHTDVEALDTSDSPHAPLTLAQRRPTAPLLMLAFGWGFLITGLMIGGALGNRLAFNDLLKATAIGNSVNFVLGALVGYIGYKTGCNSGLLYRAVFGLRGARLPVLFVAFLTICWQGIIVGAFGFAFAQSFESGAFYATAIFGGLLFTLTTYYGVRGLELVSIPATAILVAVGLLAGYLNVDAAGGWNGFLGLAEAGAQKNPISMVQAINIVIGSWIVGAISMPEYTRFARSAWVAIAIPFIVMIVAQWFLQIVGALGGVVSGSYDFTTYMLAQGPWLGAIGVIAMAFALWTTGDANLYLPAVQISSNFKTTQRKMTIVCGLLGTVLGLGIYAQFLQWIDLLASLAPPLIGPLLVEFYVLGRRRFLDPDFEALPAWRWAAFVSYGIGAASTFIAPAWAAKSLVGLAVSAAVHLMLGLAARAMNHTKVTA